MEFRGSDVAVGAFVLGSIGVIVGALILTSGIGVARYDLYMTAGTAADLTQDTRVHLQGLSVGRVAGILPVMDSATGRASVVARLTMDRRFPDGTLLSLPRGTRAAIVQRSFLGSPAVELLLPEGPATAFLEPGDTIASTRPATALDALGEVAADLRGEITTTLDESRRLLVRTTATIDETHTLLRTTGPEVRTTLQSLNRTLARTEGLLANLEPRVVALTDSVALAVADTRTLLRSLDSLAGSGTALVEENREAIRNLLGHLHRSAVVLEHFTDRVSRRPLRLFTGVEPPPDTTHPHP